MPQVQIKISPDFTAAMKQLQEKIKDVDAMTVKINQAAQRSHILIFPKARVQQIQQLNPTFRKFQQTVRRLSGMLQRTVDRLYLEVGGLARRIISGFSVESFVIAPVFRVLGFLTFNVAPFALATSLGAFRWLWNKVMALGEAMIKDRMLALQAGTSVSGIRAFRVAFAMMPNDPRLITSIGMSRVYDIGRVSSVVHWLLGVRKGQDTMDTIVQTLVSAQRFLKEQPRHLVMQRAQLFHLTEAMSEETIMALLGMSTEEIRDAARKYTGEKRRFSQTEGAQRALVDFILAIKTMWLDIETKLGRKLVESGIVDSLIRVSRATAELIDFALHLPVTEKMLKGFEEDIKWFAEWLGDTKNQKTISKVVTSMIDNFEKGIGFLSQMTEDSKFAEEKRREIRRFEARQGRRERGLPGRPGIVSGGGRVIGFPTPGRVNELRRIGGGGGGAPAPSPPSGRAPSPPFGRAPSPPSGRAPSPPSGRVPSPPSGRVPSPPSDSRDRPRTRAPSRRTTEPDVTRPPREPPSAAPPVAPTPRVPTYPTTPGVPTTPPSVPPSGPSPRAPTYPTAPTPEPIAPPLGPYNRPRERPGVWTRHPPPTPSLTQRQIGDPVQRPWTRHPGKLDIWDPVTREQIQRHEWNLEWKYAIPIRPEGKQAFEERHPPSENTVLRTQLRKYGLRGQSYTDAAGVRRWRPGGSMGWQQRKAIEDAQEEAMRNPSAIAQSLGIENIGKPVNPASSPSNVPLPPHKPEMPVEPTITRGPPGPAYPKGEVTREPIPPLSPSATGGRPVRPSVPFPGPGARGPVPTPAPGNVFTATTPHNYPANWYINLDYEPGLVKQSPRTQLYQSGLGKPSYWKGETTFKEGSEGEKAWISDQIAQAKASGASFIEPDNIDRRSDAFIAGIMKQTDEAGLKFVGKNFTPDQVRKFAGMKGKDGNYIMTGNTFEVDANRPISPAEYEEARNAAGRSGLPARFVSFGRGEQGGGISKETMQKQIGNETVKYSNMAAHWAPTEYRGDVVLPGSVGARGPVPGSTTTTPTTTTPTTPAQPTPAQPTPAQPANTIYDPITSGRFLGGVGGTSVSRGSGGHQGEDWGAPVGTPVYAVKDGIIVRIGRDNFGQPIAVIRHDDGTYTRDMHLQPGSIPAEGTRVTGGQPYARSGAANGVAHLHHERWSGDVTDYRSMRGGTLLVPSNEAGVNRRDGMVGGQGRSGGNITVPAPADQTSTQPNRTSPAPSTPTTPGAGGGGGAAYLNTMRADIRRELENNPALVNRLASIASYEHSTPEGRSAALQSLYNRTVRDMESNSDRNIDAHTRLGNQSSFYGPIRAGLVSEETMKGPDGRPVPITDERRQEVMNAITENTIQFRTDQGQPGEQAPIGVVTLPGSTEEYTIRGDKRTGRPNPGEEDWVYGHQRAYEAAVANGTPASPQAPSTRNPWGPVPVLPKITTNKFGYQRYNLPAGVPTGEPPYRALPGVDPWHDPKYQPLGKPSAMEGLSAGNIIIAQTKPPGAPSAGKPGTGTINVPRLNKVLEYAGRKNNIQIESFAGMESGHSRHKSGSEAYDIQMRDVSTGKLLDSRIPEDQAKIASFVTDATKAGATGFGMGKGTEYMGAYGLHAGFGTPAVWGAYGRGVNTPGWLQNSFNAGRENVLSSDQLDKELEELRAKPSSAARPADLTGDAVPYLRTQFPWENTPKWDPNANPLDNLQILNNSDKNVSWAIPPGSNVRDIPFPPAEDKPTSQIPDPQKEKEKSTKDPDNKDKPSQDKDKPKETKDPDKEKSVKDSDKPSSKDDDKSPSSGDSGGGGSESDATGGGKIESPA
jgi:murein DD-endopeptidase MepM/ murein hydrolase activator NlpD